MVMPSIQDHKHGKLVKLQSVRGNDMVIEGKSSPVPQSWWRLFQTGEHFLPSLLENMPGYNMSSRCSGGKVNEKRKEKNDANN